MRHTAGKDFQKLTVSPSLTYFFSECTLEPRILWRHDFFVLDIISALVGGSSGIMSIVKPPSFPLLLLEALFARSSISLRLASNVVIWSLLGRLLFCLSVRNGLGPLLRAL